MDPSAIICKYKNSFDKSITPIVLHTYISKDKEVELAVMTKLELSETETVKLQILSEKQYCDPSLLNKTKSDIKSSKLSDPFGDVSSMPFMNRDAIILANIDMVFNFSHHTSGYIIKQESVKDYNFVAIGDGPGGYSQYVMYRNPSSYGYGYTPSNHPFDKQKIDMTHFNIIQGVSDDINLDYKYFIKSVRTVEATGVDLVLGNYTNNEAITDSGYLIRLLIALSTVKIGGSFISKVKLNTELMIDLLYITTQCFNKTTLFKPLSTDINDDVYYVVAQEGKINNIEWVSYLEESHSDSLKKDRKILRLLEKVPDDFIRWVIDYNNLIILYKQYLLDIENYGITELYDTYKCKAIWNLPQIS